MHKERDTDFQGILEDGVTIRFAVQDDRLVIYGVDPDEVIVSDMAPSHENGNWLTGIDNYDTFKTIRHEEPPAVVLRRRVWWGPDGSVSYKAVYVFNKEKQEYDKFEIPVNLRDLQLHWKPFRKEN